MKLTDKSVFNFWIFKTFNSIFKGRDLYHLLFGYYYYKFFLPFFTYGEVGVTCPGIDGENKTTYRMFYTWCSVGHIGYFFTRYSQIPLSLNKIGSNLPSKPTFDFYVFTFIKVCSYTLDVVIFEKNQISVKKQPITNGLSPHFSKIKQEY